MRLRFQADADLNHIILLAALRRESGIDFQTATAAHLAGLSDPEVLSLAAAESRLVVTHDQSTMPEHFGSFIATRRSPGLIVIPQHLAPAAAADDLLLIWHATDAEEWNDRIAFLPL